MTELSELYDAASKGFHISETCGPDGKYHRISKFQTLAELQAFEDAWRKAMISVRDAALSHAAGQEVEYPEAAEVCGEAYQVVGCLLDQLGLFDTPEAEKILDNLSQHRMVHRDVLPWTIGPAPAQTPDSAEVGRDSALSRGVPEGE